MWLVAAKLDSADLEHSIPTVLGSTALDRKPPEGWALSRVLVMLHLAVSQ